MASRVVTGPDGTEWTVRRRWVRRRLRWRGSRSSSSIDFLDGADLLSLGDDLPVIGVVLVAVGVLLFAVAAVLFIVPALVFILEVLVIIVIVALGVTGRVLFRRPWTIEAGQAGADHAYEWKVTGWRAGNELMESIADQLEATGNPPGGERVPLDRT